MTILKFKTFLKSLLFHIWAGFPKATITEINYRYNICLECYDYDKKRKVCDVCGCNVNNKKQFMNKLAWADQQCPKNKWSKIIRGNNANH